MKFRIKEVVNHRLQHFYHVQYRHHFLWRDYCVTGNSPSTFWKLEDAVARVAQLKESGPPSVRYIPA